MPSKITGVSIVCSSVCSGADQRKHQSSASLAFVRGIHRCPMDSPHKGPVMQKIFDDVIMYRRQDKTWPWCQNKSNECEHYLDGLVQDCSNSSALAIELLQSCAKPSVLLRFFRNACGWFRFVQRHNFYFWFVKWPGHVLLPNRCLLHPADVLELCRFLWHETIDTLNTSWIYISEKRTWY